MQQNMTEEELELLKQIQEDLDIAKQEYGCTVDRKELLSEVLERSEHPVRPEEAELFFSGVLPSGWKNTYCREPKMLSGYLNALRKAISRKWCEDYLEPELRGLKGCESLRDCQISISQMKKDLNLPLRKDNMLSAHKQVESYLWKMRKRAGIVPDFRFIPPDRFAAIVDIYLEAMEERGDCTQEELGRLLGMTQSAVSKLRKLQITISAEREFRVLLGLLVLHIVDNMRNRGDTKLDLYLYNWVNLSAIKGDRLFSAVYLAMLLGFSVSFSDLEGPNLPVTVADLNHFLKEHSFIEQFDPNADGTFDAAPPKKLNQNAIPLWDLIRLPDYAPRLDAELTLEKIMGMDAAYLRMLYQMPEVFFSDLHLDIYNWDADLQYVSLTHFNWDTLYAYMKEMRLLRQPGLKCLISKMETITIGWNMLFCDCNARYRVGSAFDPQFVSRMLAFGIPGSSDAAAQKFYCGSNTDRRVGSVFDPIYAAQTLSVYLKEFFQLMEYLSDNRLYPDTPMNPVNYPAQMSCDRAIQYNDWEIAKPLTEPQEREYRMLFEKYIHNYWQRDLLERIKVKFSMTLQEWYFWLKMELLWFSKSDIKKWNAFMDQCLEEARKADLDEAGDATDA